MTHSNPNVPNLRNFPIVSNRHVPNRRCRKLPEVSNQEIPNLDWKAARRQEQLANRRRQRKTEEEYCPNP